MCYNNSSCRRNSASSFIICMMFFCECVLSYYFSKYVYNAVSGTISFVICELSVYSSVYFKTNWHFSETSLLTCLLLFKFCEYANFMGS